MRGSCRVRSVVSMNGRGARRCVDGTAQGGMGRRRTEARQHTTPKLNNQNQGYIRGGERRKRGERAAGTTYRLRVTMMSPEINITVGHMRCESATMH